MAKEKISKSAEETMAIAENFAQSLKPATILALEGDLGSGKTTFIKGLAKGLGLADLDEVKSPTFALMHIYETVPPIYHFDLYRLESEKEIESIGFDEFLNQPATIICIEWAGRAEKFLPPSALRVKFEMIGPTDRRIIFS